MWSLKVQEPEGAANQNAAKYERKNILNHASVQNIIDIWSWPYHNGEFYNKRGNFFLHQRFFFCFYGQQIANRPFCDNP